MRNFIVLLLFSVCLTSCSIQQDVSFHTDKSQSMLLDVDFRELMAYMKENATPQEAQDMQKMTESLESIPTSWTPLSKMWEKRNIKNKEHLTPEQEAILGKMLMKTNREGKQIVGISYKMDHITQEDQKTLKKYKNVSDETPMASLMDTEGNWEWNGKILTIEVKDLNPETVSKLFNQGNDTPNPKDNTAESGDMKQFISMLLKNYNIDLHFDQPIKNIIGNHPWITKKDDHTLNIHLDFNPETSWDPSKYSDKIMVEVE